MTSKYIYFGHHKCATRYVISILNEANRILELSSKEYHNASMFDSDLVQEQLKNPVDFIYYTNAKANYAEPYIQNQGELLKGFHIIRDPRDIIISGYFSHRNVHSTTEWNELNELRKDLKSMSQEEGIFTELVNAKQRISDLETWNYENNNIKEVKYEDMIKNPYRTFLEIFEHLQLIDSSNLINLNSTKDMGKLFMNNLIKNKLRIFKTPSEQKISPLQLLQILYERAFSKMTQGRAEGLENQHHHYRKGIAGDWKNYFTEDMKSYFKENYGDVLIKLGYEKNNDW